jgi:3',5'-cyclic-AMP phosphodiesterase
MPLPKLFKPTLKQSFSNLFDKTAKSSSSSYALKTAVTKITILLLTIPLTLMLTFCSSPKKYHTVKIGMCSDVHLPTMHDSEYRIQTFIDSMKIAQPDFIIELGDFGTPAEKYAGFFDTWNSFPGDKYHVFGNHEMDGGYSRLEAVLYRNMSNSYYSFDKNHFHFIVLDGNDPKEEKKKGYKQYIGTEQVRWLKEELAKSNYPIVFFSHQGLTSYRSGDGEEYGVENQKQIREIFESHNIHNPKTKVIACFNGHTHNDYAENINNIWYITINSMSYKWLGEAFEHIRYSSEVDKNFKWIKYTAPYKEPLFTIVEISTEGYIKIDGKQTEYVGPSPWEVGYPDSLKKYVRPAISKRFLTFELER